MIIDLRKEMSIKATSKHYDIHWTTVKNVEEKHLKEKYVEII